MTKTEKLNTSLAVVAVLISIASPFITYRLLNPSLQAYQVRGRLQVSPDLRWDKRVLMDAELDKIPKTYRLEILNVGQLPAEEIGIVAQYAFTGLGDASVKVYPPLQIETTERGNQNFITVKPSLAPRDKLTVEFAGIPSVISVTSKNDNIWTLSTGIFWSPGGKTITVGTEGPDK